MLLQCYSKDLPLDPTMVFLTGLDSEDQDHDPQDHKEPPRLRDGISQGHNLLHQLLRLILTRTSSRTSLIFKALTRYR